MGSPIPETPTDLRSSNPSRQFNSELKIRSEHEFKMKRISGHRGFRQNSRSLSFEAILFIIK